jgi:hypothetical protein
MIFDKMLSDEEEDDDYSELDKIVRESELS